MKVIELKVLGNDPIKLNERVKKEKLTLEEANRAVKDIYVNYREFILKAMEAPQQGQQAMSIGDMRRCIKIMDKLEALKDGDNLYLEDVDYEFLKPRVEATTWIVAHKNIVQYVDDVVNAPEVDMGKEEPQKKRTPRAAELPKVAA